MTRRERTRQLIELGGLVVKASLVHLTDDDRAVIYGGLLVVASNLAGDDREGVLQRLARRGRRAFAMEAEQKEQAGASTEQIRDSEFANEVR